MEVLPPYVNMFEVTDMNHNHVGFHSSSLASPSSPEFYAFQRLIRDVYHSTTLNLQNVERLQGHLHRIYTLRSADKSAFTLKCSPSRDTHLLRHEVKSLETEAKVIALVKGSTRVPVPQRISYDSHANNAIGAPFLLSSHITGISLADMGPYLSASDRCEIDRMLGSYMYSISRIRERSFGLFHRVNAGTGHGTWSEAFQSLIESVLRDAEDMLVTLPYEAIRYEVSARKTLLDQVSEPKLVAMEAGEPQNVLLDQSRRRQIVGLLGFSNVVWGDPMLASVCSNASPEFWDGFGGKPPQDCGQRVRELL
jgi:aminoglycoside phosphotransferase (APT) family kinase protein